MTRTKPKGWGTITKVGSVWQARWIEDGLRPVMRFATEQDAEDFLDDRWKRLTRGHYIAPAELTIRDLVQQYIDRRVAYKKWAPATINLNQRMATTHIYPLIGDLRILAVDPSRLQHWVDRLARTLSVNTIKKCMAILSGAYNQAVALKVLSDNPCRHVELPQPESSDRATWTEAEVAAVDALLRDDPYWLAVYRVMLLTGMRPGELRALTWSDVDFAANRIRIRRTVTTSADGKLMVGVTTKTGQVRYVALAPGARSALLGWQSAQVRRSLTPDIDYVFPSPGGKPLNQTHWRLFHDDLCLRAGVTRTTLHGLRHGFATIAMRSGLHPKVVSEMLGHKTIQITLDTYSHVSTELQDASAQRLDERLFGENSG